MPACRLLVCLYTSIAHTPLGSFALYFLEFSILIIFVVAFAGEGDNTDSAQFECLLRLLHGFQALVHDGRGRKKVLQIWTDMNISGSPASGFNLSSQLLH